MSDRSLRIVTPTAMTLTSATIFPSAVPSMGEPVTLIVKDGKVVDFQGGPRAQRFRQILEDLADENAFNLAEFGIGLNPQARLAASNLEDLGRRHCHPHRVDLQDPARH